MASTKLHNDLHRLFSSGTFAGLTDAQLVDRFRTQGDEEAFAAIVSRHGRMVLSACRSVLGPMDGAEDAFQATFLVLVRRAGSFPVHDSLAGWLYRVARRVSRQARIEVSRRRHRERIAAENEHAEASLDPARDELRRLVHQELAALPERYRMPILLCDLHGLTRAEAARALGCPPGTVAGRLARGREQLRKQLTRRGVTLTSACFARLQDSSGELLRLFQRATHAALDASAGERMTSWGSRLRALGSRGFLAPKFSLLVVLSLALATAGAATGMLGLRTHDRGQAGPASRKAQVDPGSVGITGTSTATDPDDPKTADVFSGTVLDIGGEPIAGVELHIVPESPTPTGPGAVRAVTADDGRFRFSAKDLTFTSLDGLPARRPGLLIASKPGYGPDWVRTWGETGASSVSHTDPKKEAEWTLTLARDDVPIRGRLLGPDGKPLAGASVTLAGLLVPWKKDLDAHLKKVTAPDSAVMMIDHDRSTDAPGVLPGLAHRVVTDADGRFRLGGLGRERLARLEIRAPGVVDTTIDVMTRDAPDVSGRLDGMAQDRVIHGADFTLSLKPGRTVTGMVRDRATGEPLPDVWVGPGVDSILGLTTGRYPHATDAQGRFAIGGISPAMKEMSYWENAGSNDPPPRPSVLAVPKPGQPYFLARSYVSEAGEAIVECPRGIPFRLSLRDEAGRPVEAEVTYSAIQPNSYFHESIQYVLVQAGSPLSRAARQPDGSYLGVALPGPGVVLAKTPREAGHRPDHVDPKAFFAPGRTDWTAQDLITTYGNHDTLSVETFYGGAWEDQHDFAAIVLINPAEDLKRLELSATVFPDRPRAVTLLDPEGKPVVGAQTIGLTYHPWDREPKLRAATIPIKGLHPGRARRITFLHEDRKLIGFLLARGDGDAPYTVRMQPWATVIGRIVDEEGRPPGAAGNSFTLTTGTIRAFAAHDDPAVGIIRDTATEVQGRFRLERLVPGQSHDAEIYSEYRFRGMAFRGLKLAPGEVRDLGDIRARPPAPNPK
jgi:RNA polymerase sigma factor (sigma-70 family)